jgi:ribonuclease HI
MQMVRAWTDGACEGNPGPCAYGVLIIDQHGTHHVLGKNLGQGTNNIAEYEGMIAALQWLADHAPNIPALIHTDAQLVAFRLNGTWKKKRSQHPHIQALINRAEALIAVLPLARIIWVRREQNMDADEIAARYLPS